MSISKPCSVHRLDASNITGDFAVCQDGIDTLKVAADDGSSRQLYDEAKLYSCQRLNQLQADTRILHANFQKYQWLMRSESTYQLYLVMGKFAKEQGALVTALCERIQSLGGTPIVDPRHIAELARIPRAPNSSENIAAILSRLLHATEMILIDAYMASAKISEFSNSTSIDSSISELVRTDELHAGVLCQHLTMQNAHSRAGPGTEMEL